MVNRSGASKLGCLMTLLIIAAVVYFGFNAGVRFWHYYEFKDAMQSEARYSAHRSDAVIRRRLVELADSLSLPESAQNIRIRRAHNTIYIWAEYCDHIELPLYVKEVCFSPSAQSPF